MFANAVDPMFSVKDKVAIFVALAPVTYLYNTKVRRGTCACEV